MPCNEVRLCSVNISMANVVFLKRALKSLGWRVIQGYGETLSVTTKDGVNMTITPGKNGRVDIPRGQEKKVDALKRAYTGTVLKEAKSRFGWVGNVKEQGKFVLRRRF